MTVEESDLVQIVTEIWTSMLGLEPEPWLGEPGPRGGKEFRAAVQITGSWQGALVVECPESSARAFTAAMLGTDDGDDMGVEELRDVVGELSNMAGGNLKAIVGADTRLSLPTVIFGTDLDLTVPGGREDLRVPFMVGDDLFTVVVVSSEVQPLRATG
jgi:chemotaxis protein CheX